MDVVGPDEDFRPSMPVANSDYAEVRTRRKGAVYNKKYAVDSEEEEDDLEEKTSSR